MTRDNLELYYAILCPKCLELSWNGSACTDRRCEYVEDEPPPAQFLAPRHILLDRYFVGHLLGQGGQAITYRALDIVTNKKVAIKELFPDMIVDRDHGADVIPKDPRGREVEYFDKAKDDFLREIEYVKTINHPNIPKYLDDFEENNTLYLVTEYEEGSTLTEFVSIFGEAQTREGYKRISIDKATQLLRPIMGALIYLHESRSSVHRDVSPDNIFIRDIHGATLIDFGSARRAGEGSCLQKAGFTAPEVVEGRKTEQTAASDVYSLAATLYWCCTGDFAWFPPEGETVPQFRSLRDKGVECSDAANMAVTKALARDPKERFRSVEDFEQALKPMAESKPVAKSKPVAELKPVAESKPQGGNPHPPKWSRETLRKVIIAETLIIAAVLITCCWFYSKGKDVCNGQGCSIIQQIGMGMAQ